MKSNKLIETISHNFGIRSAARRIPIKRRRSTVFLTAGLLTLTLAAPISEMLPLLEPVEANSTYFNLASGNLNFVVSAATAGQITANDNWSGVPSVEGYFGGGLTATHGVDPQTVLTTEFTNSTLPNSPTNVNANKSNPSAFNAGGVTEFDSGPYLAIAIQGNTSANPYLVFYLNTTNRTNTTINYQVQDIDGGSNSAVSPVALQYRLGETGNFTNLPAGYIADATDSGVAGRITNVNVTLPAVINNQPKVQVRIITTNAANLAGSSSPDEWIGINNVAVSSNAVPTAAAVLVSGRITDADGRGIRNASVSIHDMSGNLQSALTGPFGYYQFTDVQSGEAYVVAVACKRYSFNPSAQAITILDEVAGLDFTANR